MDNLYSIKNKLLSKSDFNQKKGYKSPTFWLTGLSGSGKSTLAIAIEKQLFDQGVACKVLDGDNIRSGLSNDLSFSTEDREENIRRIAEVNKLFNENGIVTISSFISPSQRIRDLAKSIIGKDNFYEVFINASLKECEERDVKGLYKKAREGIIPNFTGVSAPYNAPENPALIIKTDQLSFKESCDLLAGFIHDKIRF